MEDCLINATIGQLNADQRVIHLDAIEAKFALTLASAEGFDGKGGVERRALNINKIILKNSFGRNATTLLADSLKFDLKNIFFNVSAFKLKNKKF